MFTTGQHSHTPPSFAAINQRLQRITGFPWSLTGEGKIFDHASPWTDRGWAEYIVDQLDRVGIGADVEGQGSYRVIIREKTAEQIMKVDLSTIVRMEHEVNAVKERQPKTDIGDSHEPSR